MKIFKYIILLLTPFMSVSCMCKNNITDEELVYHINTKTSYCETDYECTEVLQLPDDELEATFVNPYSGYMYIKKFEFNLNDDEINLIVKDI